MTIIVDTPDYQRGVVSAQILLAVLQPPGGGVELVIPPNAETLIVAAGAGDTAQPEVIGFDTGITYAGQRAQAQFQPDAAPVWIFDISSVLDEQVEVSFGSTPTVATWYFYTDSAARVVVDVSKAANGAGVQYVIPTIPATDIGDHPPVELLLKNVTLTASGTILAAPGAGKRYRVFSVQMATVTGGVLATAFDATAGPWLGVVAGPGASQTTIPPQGYPMATNAALGYSLQAGAGSVVTIVYYTIETV